MDDSEKARALLAETLVEREQEGWTESSNTSNPEEPEGRNPRSYGLVGAYARIWAFSLGAMGLAFTVFLLLRVL